MCIRFVFLLMTRFASWLRLPRREEAWKTAEILILRHQLAVLQRRECLWVPRTSSTSCDQPVFVDQTTDAGAPSDTVLLKFDRFG
jgi:hypothetical protein